MTERTETRTADGNGGGIVCPECGNREDFSGWIRAHQRVDLSGNGTYREAFGDDDLDPRGGDLSRREGESAVASDVVCGSCSYEIGDVRFDTGASDATSGGGEDASSPDVPPATG